ncbi:uncharacterized protein LOC106053947 isoform X1 [Biomphalaria glabrata]|uniref:Uncharacterized protein LOC106053947 isoform X1 n=1 Tax=Biomphalaria glabrata TaxID=6526 RepID=A0A9W3BQK7_BIOGL|nr:uncharacterized protein LOC106053947 isoform X1 [Biomphalaria glabrata]
MIIIIIVFILMKGSSSQSISWFRVFSISFSCRQYGVVEEDVDTIGVEVALNYTGVTNPAYKWTLMDVVFSRNSMKIKSPSISVDLVHCSSTIVKTKVICLNVSDIMLVTLHVPSSAEFNKTTVFVVWKTIHNNFLTSYHEDTPLIVRQHLQSLTMNQVPTDLNIQTYMVPYGTTVNVVYCVRQVDHFKLSISVGKKVKHVTNEDCVSQTFVYLHVNTVLRLSFEETNGMCNRSHLYEIYFEPNKLRSTSDCVQLSSHRPEFVWILAISTSIYPTLTFNAMSY